jgi:hypothetical protein
MKHSPFSDDFRDIKDSQLLAIMTDILGILRGEAERRNWDSVSASIEGSQLVIKRQRLRSRRETSMTAA